MTHCGLGAHDLEKVQWFLWIHWSRSLRRNCLCSCHDSPPVSDSDSDSCFCNSFFHLQKSCCSQFLPQFHRNLDLLSSIGCLLGLWILIHTHKTFWHFFYWNGFASYLSREVSRCWKIFFWVPCAAPAWSCHWSRWQPGYFTRWIGFYFFLVGC